MSRGIVIVGVAYMFCYHPAVDKIKRLARATLMRLSCTCLLQGLLVILEPFPWYRNYRSEAVYVMVYS